MELETEDENFESRAEGAHSNFSDHLDAEVIRHQYSIRETLMLDRRIQE